jgi:hypothetical protein
MTTCRAQKEALLSGADFYGPSRGFVYADFGRVVGQDHPDRFGGGIVLSRVVSALSFCRVSRIGLSWLMFRVGQTVLLCSAAVTYDTWYSSLLR